MQFKELAQALGVSSSTVSIAINGRKGINEQTRKRILDAVKQYGMEINRKKPPRGQTSVINLVIYKKHGQVYGDTPFFSAVIEGISSQIRKLKYNLQIFFFYGNQDAGEQIHSLVTSVCAGMILLATEMNDEDIEIFRQLPLPLVVLDSYVDFSGLNCIAINNIQGACAATRFLIDRGHTTIGHIASSVAINNFRDRRAGFLKAVSGASGGGKEITSGIVRVAPTEDGAYNDMTAFLSKHPKLPSAFFADNDIIAIACIHALKDSGYTVPDDVSIVGFDDIPMAKVTSPKLTTIRVPKEQFGMYAVTRLNNLISKPTPSSIKILIDVTLEVRGSVLNMNDIGG
jgi:LacI family transcriptional regulator